MNNRIERKKEFIKATAEFLGGVNQCRMSIGLEAGGQLGEAAKIWVNMRQAVPGLMGYPTVEETEKALIDFLG